MCLPLHHGPRQRNPEAKYKFCYSPLRCNTLLEQVTGQRWTEDSCDALVHNFLSEIRTSLISQKEECITAVRIWSSCRTSELQNVLGLNQEASNKKTREELLGLIRILLTILYVKALEKSCSSLLIQNMSQLFVAYYCIQVVHYSTKQKKYNPLTLLEIFWDVSNIQSIAVKGNLSMHFHLEKNTLKNLNSTAATPADYCSLWKNILRKGKLVDL